MASSFSSTSLGLRIQKKVAGKFSTKAFAKNFIDDEIGKLLDLLHNILSKELDQQTADKVVKNLIKVTVKIGILFKNNQFNDSEKDIGLQLHKKLRNAALTVITFHEVDFSYDQKFIVSLVAEIGELLHNLVNNHLTSKSHTRIDSIINTFSNTDLLDKVFAADGTYHCHLPQISNAFSKVVETEW